MAVNTTVQVRLPAMGESVREGTVLEWHKQEGDTVDADEPLVDVSTDKVDAEVPAPAAGTLVKILAAEGETVAVGAVLAEIAPRDGAGDDGAAATPAARATPDGDGDGASDGAAGASAAPATSDGDGASDGAAGASAAPATSDGDGAVTPAARLASPAAPSADGGSD